MNESISKVPQQPLEKGIPETDTRYANYVLIILGIVSFINYGDRMIISVLLEPIKAEFGFSDSQLGLLTGFAFAVTYATFGMPLARLADNKSRTAILSIVIAFWGIMTALCGAAQNYIQLLFARIGVGLGEAGCVPTSHSLISDYFPRARRVFALGMFHAAGSIGVFVCIALAGLIASTLGWRWAFILIGLPNLLLSFIVWKTVREPPRGCLEKNYTPPATPLKWRAAFGTLLKRSTFVHVVIGISLAGFTFFGSGQWIPAFLSRSHEMPLAQIGFYFGIAVGIGMLIGQVAGSVFAPALVMRDRRWELWVPAISYSACAASFMLAFLAPNAVLAIALVFLANLLGGISFGPMMSSVQSVAEPHLRATAVSIVMFASAMMGQGAGSFVVGFMSDLLTPVYGGESLRISLLISTLMMMWSVVHFVLAARSMHRDRIN
jgi:predicted MFS family arabinose efflux permease